MWEQVKQTMPESAREVCGSARVKGKNPKNIWWNDIKAAVRRKEAGRGCWQLVIKRQKKDVWKCTEKRRERLKGVYIREKRK